MRVILFDIDGTLLTMGRAARDAFAMALSGAAGRPVDPDGYSFSGKTDPHIFTYQFTRSPQLELVAIEYILILQVWSQSNMPTLVQKETKG